MPFSYLNFRFKYIDGKGKKTPLIPEQARVDIDGIRLGEDVLQFDDIYEVHRYRNRLNLRLLPYLPLGKSLSRQIIPGSSSLMLGISDGTETAFAVKSAIDQRISSKIIREAKQKMEYEGSAVPMRTAKCPSCDCVLHLTDYRDTPLIYCKYCENIFDKHGDLLAHTADHGICPECGYYNRLRSRTDFRFYFLPFWINFRPAAVQKFNLWPPKLKIQSFRFKILPGETESRSNRRYCCDSCADRTVNDSFWKNAVWLAGLIPALYMSYRSKSGRNPAFLELSDANRLAQEGNFEKANEIFSLLMLKNDGQPGLHYNWGMAFLKEGNEEKAAREFQKALLSCGNYLPVVEVLKIYTSLSL